MPRQPTEVVRDERAGHLRWLVPAATFLIGLALGGAVVAVGGGAGGDRSAVGPTPAASARPSATPRGTTVTVPGACSAAGERAQEALGLLDSAVGAVGDLDAARLQATLDRAQRLRSQLQSLADECRRGVRVATPAPTS